MGSAMTFASPQDGLVRFGERLRAIRLSRKLNQVEFGQLTGVSGNSQMAYEAGKTAPPISYLYQLAEHDVNIGHLLTGERRDADAIDATFLGDIAGEVMAAHNGAGMEIGPIALVQCAGTIYSDLAETYETIAECRSALKFVMRKFRQDLENGKSLDAFEWFKNQT